MAAKVDDNTIMRGVQLFIFPNKRQEEVLDRWRCQTVRLWNLLLELEMAAYSGQNRRPELRWRHIWADIVRQQYEADSKIWKSGRPAGLKRKGIPTGAERIAQHERELANYEATGSKGAKPRKPLIPVEPSADLLDKIFARNVPVPTIEQQLGLYAKMTPERLRRARREFVRANPSRASEAEAAIEQHRTEPKDYSRPEQPGVFIWGAGGRELQALLARLKEVPQTAWIGDLPSHSSQRIATELLEALSRVKSHGAGFPRFKTVRRDGGSIYLPNTRLAGQIAVTEKKGRVSLPKGIGTMGCSPDNEDLDDVSISKTSGLRLKHGGLRGSRRTFWEKFSDGVLQGGRIYRRGDDWILSVQYKLPKPEPLPATERSVGVKIAAAVLFTTVDDEGRARQVDSLPIQPLLAKRYRFLQFKKSRQEEAHKRKVERMRVSREKAGKTFQNRMPRTKEYQPTLARLTKLHIVDTARRDALIHEETTKIVQQYGTVTLRPIETAKLMRKGRPRQRQETDTDAKIPRCARVKSVRRIMARAAMSRAAATLKYKAIDSGRRFIEIEPEFKDVQTCHVCGTENPKMRDGRRMFHCDNCGTKLHKDKNAARNAKDGRKCLKCGTFNPRMRNGGEIKLCEQCGGILGGRH